MDCYSAEPTYGGKSLTGWLTESSKVGAQPAEIAQANAALRAIGTNAIPYLLEWGALAEFENHSFLGFQALGPAAASAIPTLAIRATSTNEHLASIAVRSLNVIGDPALPALLNAITNRHDGVRTYAILSIELSPKARGIIPLLLRDLDEPDPYYRWRAATALGSLQLEAYRVVPRLSKLLQDKDTSVRFSAVMALGQFKAFAASATPAISKLLTDQDLCIRSTATNALLGVSNAIVSVSGGPSQQH